MARDRLNREIIKRLMENFGVLPHPHFGKAGLSSDNLKIDDKLSLKDDSEIITHHNIYAGQINLKNPISTIKGMVADISEEDLSEFIVLFRMNAFPIYAVRLSFDDQDNGLFLNYLDDDEESKWYEADVHNKALVLAGMETVADAGALWDPCTNYDDLHKGLLHIAGLEEA